MISKQANIIPLLKGSKYNHSLLIKSSVAVRLFENGPFDNGPLWIDYMFKNTCNCNKITWNL